LDRVRKNLDPAPGSRNWGSELMTLSSTCSTLPRREKAVLNGLFPEQPPDFLACYHVKLVCSCRSRWL
jgi:hypothetical protein